MKWTDPYAVLQIAHGCSEHEIRQAYRRALLKFHPDKQVASWSLKPGLFTVDDINEAYRQIKARSLNQDTPQSSEEPVLYSEIVDLSDFNQIELSNGYMQWERDCRCGDTGYVLLEQDLELNGDADEIAVQCLGCSLWILVQYAVE